MEVGKYYLVSGGNFKENGYDYVKCKCVEEVSKNYFKIQHDGLLIPAPNGKKEKCYVHIIYEPAFNCVEAYSAEDLDDRLSLLIMLLKEETSIKTK